MYWEAWEKCLVASTSHIEKQEEDMANTKGPANMVALEETLWTVGVRPGQVPLH